MYNNHIRPLKQDFKARMMAVLFYVTSGIYAVIYLLYKGIKKEYPSHFIKYHCMQALFMMILLSILGYVVNIIVGFLYVIPFLNRLVEQLLFYVTVYEIFFHLSVLQISIITLITYASIQAFRGKYSEIPILSNWIRQLL